MKGSGNSVFVNVSCLGFPSHPTFDEKKITQIETFSQLHMLDIRKMECEATERKGESCNFGVA